MSERVPAWAESDERYPEREAEWRAAIARAERAEGLCAEAMYALGQQGRPADLMPMAVRAVVSRADAAEVRAERAEAGLAALREASRSVVHVAVVPYSDEGNALLQAFDKVIADTAAAAEAYRARIAEETAAPWKAALDAARRELQRTLDERDTLAAALAEVRDADREYDAAYYALNSTHAVGSPEADAVVPRMVAATERRKHALAALPADLAADAFRRVRAEWTREDPVALAYGIATREDAGPNLGDVYERPDGGTMTVIEIKRGCWRVYVYEDERGGTHERQHHRGWVLRARAADERGGK